MRFNSIKPSVLKPKTWPLVPEISSKTMYLPCTPILPLSALALSTTMLNYNSSNSATEETDIVTMPTLCNTSSVH